MNNIEDDRVVNKFYPKKENKINYQVVITKIFLETIDSHFLKYMFSVSKEYYLGLHSKPTYNEYIDLFKNNVKEFLDKRNINISVSSQKIGEVIEFYVIIKGRSIKEVEVIIPLHISSISLYDTVKRENIIDKILNS